jgi:AsmA protein
MAKSGAPRGKLWRALLLLFILFAATLAGGVFYLTSRISPERISSEASALLRRKLGFALSIGEIRLTWTGNAELRRICLRNEAMLSARCLFAADTLQLDLRLLPLLRRQIEIRAAELENCELNLFSETAEAADKKKITRNSWEASLPPTDGTTGAGTAEASPVAMRLEGLQLRNAVIAHEAHALPIPLGRTALSLELRSAGRRLSFHAQLPNNSEVAAELELNIADFLRTARLIAKGLRLADTDRVSGRAECTRCNVSALDKRAGLLSGKLSIDADAKALRLAGESVQLTTQSIYAPALVWNGHAKLALPELYPVDGEGKVSGHGLALQYRRLGGNSKSGVETDFDVEADLARVPGLSHLEGALLAQAKLRNRILSASFSLKKFATTSAGLSVAAERLSFTGNSLDSLLQTGNGQMSLRLGRGKIRDSFLQKGVLSGPLHKLEEKFSDIEFASAQAELRLNPNKIQVQKFYFDAEEWHVTYRAEADAQWQGKAALTLRFRSSFVENVANPLHLGISDRQDGDFYDLPFACRGAVLSGDCYKKNW